MKKNYLSPLYQTILTYWVHLVKPKTKKLILWLATLPKHLYHTPLSVYQEKGLHLLKYIRTHSKTLLVCLAFLLAGLCIYNQQVAINELQDQLESQNDVYNPDSFDYRITNLEHISNAHAKRLKTIEKTDFIYNRQINQLTWRVMQLEWLHPNLKVNTAPPKATPLPKFDSNPYHVPNPVLPNHSIYLPGSNSSYSI